MKLPGVQMEERDFFEEVTEQKRHTMVCPHCGQPGEYELSWLVRRKRAQVPRGADELRSAKFAKARSYMVRRDDLVGCKTFVAAKDLRWSGSSRSPICRRRRWERRRIGPSGFELRLGDGLWGKAGLSLVSAERWVRGVSCFAPGSGL